MTDIVEITAEEIARHYAAALDSVALINSEKPESVSDEEWSDTIKRDRKSTRLNSSH